MRAFTVVVVVLGILILRLSAMSVRIVRRYEEGVLFRLGRVIGERPPGMALITLVDVLHHISLRIETIPIQSEVIITRDDVSVDVSAEAYLTAVDAINSVAIDNVSRARARHPGVHSGHAEQNLAIRLDSTAPRSAPRPQAGRRESRRSTIGSARCVGWSSTLARPQLTTKRAGSGRSDD